MNIDVTDGRYCLQNKRTKAKRSQPSPGRQSRHTQMILGRRPAYGKVTNITTIHKRLNERKTPAQPAVRAPTPDICVATQMSAYLYQL